MAAGELRSQKKLEAGRRAHFPEGLRNHGDIEGHSKPQPWNAAGHRGGGHGCVVCTTCVRECRTQPRRAWSGNRQLGDGTFGMSESTDACVALEEDVGEVGGGRECAITPNS